MRRPSTWYRLVGWLRVRCTLHVRTRMKLTSHTHAHMYTQYNITYFPYGYATVTPRSPSSDMPVRSTLAVRVKELPVFHLVVVVRCNRR